MTGVHPRTGPAGARHGVADNLPGASKGLPIAVIIPVKPLRLGKTRLAEALSPEQRESIITAMFLHVLDVATAVVHPSNCYVLGRSRRLRRLAIERGAKPVCDQGHDLNMSLDLAAAGLRNLTPLPLLTLAADLPLLERDDLYAIYDALRHRNADAVLAPDRAGTGTNAVLLRQPGQIGYSYGAGSFAAHKGAIRTRGMRVATIRRSGLAADLDWPADIVLARALRQKLMETPSPPTRIWKSMV